MPETWRCQRASAQTPQLLVGKLISRFLLQEGRRRRVERLAVAFDALSHAEIDIVAAAADLIDRV